MQQNRKKRIVILHTICFMRERLDYKNIFMHGIKKIKIDIEWGKKIYYYEAVSRCCNNYFIKLEFLVVSHYFFYIRWYLVFEPSTAPD